MNFENDYGLFFGKDHLLADNKNRLNCLLSFKEVSKATNIRFSDADYFYLGEFKSKHLYAVQADLKEIENYLDFISIPIRELLVTVPADWVKIIIKGKQLINWHRSSLYCGSCGSPTLISNLEIAKICQACEKIIYPYSYSAIILLLEHEDQILLARSAHFAEGMYSTLAGFIGAGESCEEAIQREVAEEVNISVKNVHYFGSQAWPFPNSFMLGFTAEYAGGELHFKDQEIEDAKWFRRCNLPKLPSKASIARHLIDSFINRK
jgi:NAD+ diphosphatase